MPAIIIGRPTARVVYDPIIKISLRVDAPDMPKIMENPSIPPPTPKSTAPAVLRDVPLRYCLQMFSSMARHISRYSAELIGFPSK